MTTPSPPPHGLDAEERALARALPRLHGRSEPGPDLDARILAAARAAVQPGRPARTSRAPRLGWIARASLAASLMLAVGLAWRLRPLPEAPVPAAGPDLARESAVAASQAAPDPPPAAMRAPTPPEPLAKPGAADAGAIALPESASAVPARVAVPPPPPPPAPASAPEPAAPASAESRMAQPFPAAPAPPPVADAPAREMAPAVAGKAAAADSVRPVRPQATSPVQSGARNEAERAALGDFADDPEDDVPPATVDTPAVRDAWLQRIRQLLDQGREEEARASLAEFRRRYPDAALPAALQGLEPDE